MTKENAREQRFIMDHGLRVQSNMTGKTGPQEWLLAMLVESGCRLWGTQGSHLPDQEANRAQEVDTNLETPPHPQ